MKNTLGHLLSAISPSDYFWIGHLAYPLGLTIHLSIFLRHLLSNKPWTFLSDDFIPSVLETTYTTIYVDV